MRTALLSAALLLNTSRRIPIWKRVFLPSSNLYNMIIQLQDNITAAQQTQVSEVLKGLGLSVNEIKTQSSNYLVCPENKTFDIRTIGNLAGIRDVHIVRD